MPQAVKWSLCPSCSCLPIPGGLPLKPTAARPCSLRSGSRACQAVDPRHDHHIAAGQAFEQLKQLPPISLCAARLLAENLGTPLSAQLLKLGVERLPIGADAEIILLHDTSVDGGRMTGEGKQRDRIICEACGTSVPIYDVVSYGSIELGYRELCTCCFNTEVASVLGLERFEHVGLHPVVMTDCAGERHEFHFRIRLLGSVMALDAFELETGAPGGYQFQILGKPDDEPLLLLGSLIERIRRNLSVRHLLRSEHGTQIADRTVCGRIEWDESEDGRVPLLVIDGQEVSWDEFGRMLMSFEGWQLRVVIRDRSEEV